MPWDIEEEIRTQRIVESNDRIYKELKGLSDSIENERRLSKINTSGHAVQQAKSYTPFIKKLWSFFMWDTIVGLPVFVLIAFVGTAVLSQFPLPPVLTAESIVDGMPNYFIASAIVGIIVWGVLAIIKIMKLARK